MRTQSARRTGSPGPTGLLAAVLLVAGLLVIAAPGPVSAAAPIVPGLPRSVTAQPGKTMSITGPLRIAFSPPITNGGSVVLDYRAVCTSTDGGVRVLGATAGSPFTLGGLTTGRTYRCAVRARNAVGFGALSVASGPVIVGAPAPPTLERVSRPAVGRLRVIYTPNANNGSRFTGYTVGCASADGGTPRVAIVSNPLLWEATVAGLSPGRTYVCRARARNARGLGLPSSASAPRVA
ncbi:MAG: fibronectin type III domain-containing protein [Actinomycetota bacterium]